MAKRLIKSINIMSVSGDTQGIERIDSQIKALILSMVGTIPGSRGFGLEREFISNFNSRLYMRGSCKNTQFFQ